MTTVGEGVLWSVRPICCNMQNGPWQICTHSCNDDRCHRVKQCQQHLVVVIRRWQMTALAVALFGCGIAPL